MDKMWAGDPEGGPEKDGGMNFEDCAASIRYYYFVQYVDYVCK